MTGNATDAAVDGGSTMGNKHHKRTATQESSTTASSAATSDRQASKRSSASNSATHTPLASRDSSPIRPPARTSTSKSTLTGARSRKNSLTDISPSRNPRSQRPQPPGLTRALSAALTPSLPPSIQDSNIKPPGPQKNPSSESTKENGSRLPISPRLRSPPPLHRPSTIMSQRLDQDAPAISVQRATPSPQPLDSSQVSESETEEIQLQSGVRTPARSSTLETVQEVSLPNSPKLSTDDAIEKVTEKLQSALERETSDATVRARPLISATEPIGETVSVKAEGKRSAGGGVTPALISRQSSSLSTRPVKGKAPGEGPVQNMTVETEVVATKVNVNLAPPNAAGSSNTLKTKPSVETIKPKKDKKRTTRKQSAVNSGTASSRAEIFEQKVASAVDEADDSDSEETFVYDSNPPDGPRGRYHSRTPSATSMISQAERNAMRSIHAVMQESGPPTMVRKHTKFAAPAAGGDSTAGEEDGRGTGRNNAASSRGTGPGRHAHQAGRWARNGHTSIIDSEVFNSTRTAKLSTGGNSRTSSGPSSPRNGSSRNLANGKRPPMAMVNSYDMDDTTGADDERTPLLHSSSSRSTRAQRGRRTQMSQRQLESQSYNSRPSYLNRFAACLVVTMMLLVVITGAIGFMFATSQPLTNIELTAIKNVIASEPELMFDLTLRAHNPNIVVVTIDDANLEIFAKSIHAGSDTEWWRNPHGPPDPAKERVPSPQKGEVGISDDPDPDIPDDDSAPNMRLGTITSFDSSLSFEGSFFHKGMSSSTGSMRLALPGNATAGGSERWNRILQDEFDLIIKGIVTYNLPLSQKVRSASVSGRTTIKPNSANDPSLKPNSTLSAIQ